MARIILKDRLSAVAFAMLVACLLLLQGLMGGFAQGAMAAASTDPLHALCSSVETGAVAPDGDDAAKKARQCPCGTLCQLASTVVFAASDAAGLIVAIDGQGVPVAKPRAAASPLSPLRGKIPEPRAPPSFS